VRIAKRILKDMSKPLNLGGHEVFTSASIGIVLVTEGYDRPESILRDADTAMYRAKEQGKSRYKVFNQKMHDQALRLLELETDLRRAADRDEFFLAYQPIVSIEDNSITGFEALIRWRHPRYGVIPPGEFIPLAEDSGLIYSIGQSALREVAAQARSWIDKYPESFSRNGQVCLSVNVNISGKQFMQPFFVAQVAEILGENRLEPKYIKFEITENVLMDHATAAADILIKFSRLGIGLCMDDFGTGYSSLSYLQRFPIDTIKVDRSFVGMAREDAHSRSIVRTVVSLGLSLGLNVVAEGVETMDQLDLLKSFGCQYAQGYLFAKPLSPDQVEGLLRDGVLEPAVGKKKETEEEKQGG